MYVPSTPSNPGPRVRANELQESRDIINDRSNQGFPSKHWLDVPWNKLVRLLILDNDALKSSWVEDKQTFFLQEHHVRNTQTATYLCDLTPRTVWNFTTPGPYFCTISSMKSQPPRLRSCARLPKHSEIINLEKRRNVKTERSFTFKPGGWSRAGDIVERRLGQKSSENLPQYPYYT